MTRVYYPHVRCASLIISHGRKSHSLSTQQPSTTRKLWVFPSLHNEPWRHGALFIYCLLCFQVVYKEVERRSAVGSDDLSLHNITIGSTLFNTQSKCMSVFAIIKNIVFDFLIWFTNSFVVVAYSRRDLPTASPNSCGQTRPRPSQSQDRCLYFGI